MSDFEKSIFPNSLGQSLGFDETEISRAKCIPGKIFCNMLDEDDPDSFLNCEVSKSSYSVAIFRQSTDFSDHSRGIDKLARRTSF